MVYLSSNSSVCCSEASADTQNLAPQAAGWKTGSSTVAVAALDVVAVVAAACTAEAWVAWASRSLRRRRRLPGRARY